jgi:hypothetical protein
MNSSQTATPTRFPLVVVFEVEVVFDVEVEFEVEVALRLFDVVLLPVFVVFDVVLLAVEHAPKNNPAAIHIAIPKLVTVNFENFIAKVFSCQGVVRLTGRT